jgi:hypothetical protein
MGDTQHWPTKENVLIFKCRHERSTLKTQKRSRPKNHHDGTGGNVAQMLSAKNLKKKNIFW